MNRTTSSRKKEHVDIVMKKGMQYATSAGFDEVMLVHSALPELNFGNIDTRTKFLGKELAAPLAIEAMTGGYPEGGKINKELAKVAEKEGMVFGLGSQRAMIENASLKDTYYVRDVAPSIPIIANIGAYQLKKYPAAKVEEMVADVDADALAVHLNPLQEIIQPEGDMDFSVILDAIAITCDKISVPVIAKETGAGIGSAAAKKLKEAGVKYIDVAGAGGTSWSAIEYERKGGVPGFADWGIPTVACLLADKGIAPLIASGGVRSGIDAAKSIALGAEIAGAAQPFLRAYGRGELQKEITTWKEQLRVSMFLTGSKDVAALKKAKIHVSERMKELATSV